MEDVNEIQRLAQRIEQYHQTYLKVLNGATSRIEQRLDKLESELVGGAGSLREGSVLARVQILENNETAILKRVAENQAQIEQHGKSIRALETKEARYRNIVAGFGIAWGVILILLVYIFTQLAG